VAGGPRCCRPLRGLLHGFLIQAQSQPSCRLGINSIWLICWSASSARWFWHRLAAGGEAVQLKRALHLGCELGVASVMGVLQQVLQAAREAESICSMDGRSFPW
jgi:hypothetical protein